MANTIDTMLPEEILRGLIDGTLTEFEDDTVTSIGDRKFSNMTSLTRVSLSNATSIGESAFRDCTNLADITFQNATSVDKNAFQGTNITSITDANFPSLGVDTTCSISLAMSSLVSIKLTGGKISLGTIGAFQNSIPNAITVEFPNAARDLSSKSAAIQAFYGNAKIELFDLGYVSSLPNMFAYGCANLRTIILRRTSSPVSLGGFSYSILGGVYSNPSSSTIYVPQALISSYQTATHWATGYANGLTFASIEGSIYE